MIPIAFNYQQWVSQYPEFASVPEAEAQNCFDAAIANVPVERIICPLEQARLLNLATAHVAKLFAAVNGALPSSLIVGKMTNATEGSVTIGLSYSDPTTDTQAWWNQTSYGALFWVSTLKYRTAFYVAGPQYSRAALVPFFGARRW